MPDRSGTFSPSRRSASWLNPDWKSNSSLLPPTQTRPTKSNVVRSSAPSGPRPIQSRTSPSSVRYAVAMPSSTRYPSGESNAMTPKAVAWPEPFMTTRPRSPSTTAREPTPVWISSLRSPPTTSNPDPVARITSAPGVLAAMAWTSLTYVFEAPRVTSATWTNRLPSHIPFTSVKTTA